MIGDSPRRIAVPRGDEIIAAERALRPRTAILALAEDLADLGIRSRLVDDTGVLLRCWEDRRISNVITVSCRQGQDERLRFWRHPSGEELGDAEEVHNPGQARDVSRVIAAAFSTEGEGCASTRD